MAYHYQGLSPTSSLHPKNVQNCAPFRFAYLDASNIFIGAQQVAAYRTGLATSPVSAASLGTIIPSTRLGLARLRALVLGTDQAAANARAVCVLSTKPGVTPPIVAAAKAAGWQPVVVQRAADGTEKEADTALAVEMVADVLSRGLPPQAVEITLLSGDRDFCPAIEALTKQGFRVDVMAWEHSTSHRVVGAASRFLPLDPHFDLVTFHA
jgi:hypothetical protein